MSFIKDDVTESLNIGHSMAGADAALFKPQILRKLPKLKAWVEKPDGKEGDEFRDMTPSEFKTYIKDRIERYNERKQSMKGKDKGKRWAKVSSDDGDDDDVPIRRAKKGRLGASANSDEIDTDSM
jgi:hypothetical protein